MKYFLSEKRESFLTLSFIFLVSILFSSCSVKTYTPEIKSEFETDAVYTFGEFTYKCKIIKTADYVSVAPLETRASGMVIKCNGKSVTFTKGSFEKSFPVNDIDATNPAYALYCVFTSLDTASAEYRDGRYYFSSKIPAGEYILTVSKASEFISLSLPQAGISIEFLY